MSNAAIRDIGLAILVTAFALAVFGGISQTTYLAFMAVFTTLCLLIAASRRR